MKQKVEKSHPLSSPPPTPQPRPRSPRYRRLPAWICSRSRPGGHQLCEREQGLGRTFHPPAPHPRPRASQLVCPLLTAVGRHWTWRRRGSGRRASGGSIWSGRRVEGGSIGRAPSSRVGREIIDHIEFDRTRRRRWRCRRLESPGLDSFGQNGEYDEAEPWCWIFFTRRASHTGTKEQFSSMAGPPRAHKWSRGRRCSCCGGR
jgi:hypothetical protein